MKPQPASITIGAALKARADAHTAATGLNQSDLARECGMTRQQLHRILAGHIPNPGILTVARIAHALGTTLAELFPDSRQLTSNPPPTKRSMAR